MTGLTLERAAHSRAVRRLAVVAAGVLVSVAAWAVVAAVVPDLSQPGFGGSAPRQLTAGAVLVASLLAGLLGWASLVAVERVTARARTRWLAVALAGLLVSLGGPLSGTGVSLGNRMALMVLHVVVAAVVIPGLLRTCAPVDPARPQAR